jgi:putative membrane protein
MMNRSVNYIILIPFSLAFVVLSSCGQRVAQDESKTIAEDKNNEKFDTKTGEKEAQFVVNEVSSAFAEIRMAELAQQQSTDQEVKDVASMLKSEHSALLKNLQDYAASNAISIPTEATDKAQKRANDLANEKEGFDKKWCAEVRDMHKQTIDDFEEASNYVSNPRLKEWVNKMLPSIRAHHDKIRATHERLK